MTNNVSQYEVHRPNQPNNRFADSPVYKASKRAKKAAKRLRHNCLHIMLETCRFHRANMKRYISNTSGKYETIHFKREQMRQIDA